MKISKPTLAAAILAVASFALPTFAQNDPPGIAARVAFLSGPVSLEVQGDDAWSSAPLNYPMTSGDRIYIEPNGHAAVQIGSTDLRLWGGTDITLTNLNEQYEQIGIAAGSMRVRVFAMQPGGTIEVDTPSGAVIIQNPGDYRINVYPGQQASLVAVYTRHRADRRPRHESGSRPGRSRPALRRRSCRNRPRRYAVLPMASITGACSAITTFSYSMSGSLRQPRHARL